MGGGNPGDKPGYKLLPLSGTLADDNDALNALADQGYSVEEVQPPALTAFNYILLSNYDKKNS